MSGVKVPLTTLQTYEDMRLVLVAPREGWKAEEDGLEVALVDQANIPAGSYEARGRATTTRPGRGSGVALEVYVFALEGGELRAVRTGDGSLGPAA
jgi:hypothetical protein